MKLPRFLLLLQQLLFLPSPSAATSNWGKPLWPDVCTQNDTKTLPFCDISLSLPAHAADVVERLSVDEKQLLIVDGAQGVASLHLPGYRWWSEALHGVGAYKCPKNGSCPTSFPAPSAMGAAYNDTLYHMFGEVIGREARALRHEPGRRHRRRLQGNIGSGITEWAPTINMQRDPRWGRNQEVPSEDPVHAQRYAQQVVQGMQGNHSKYAMVGATCKHFLANSLESWHGFSRHNFDAQVSAADLTNYYLPAFKACVDAGALGVMCSYNSVNTVPMCANEKLLNGLLRSRWNWTGYVTSDCGAMSDIFRAVPQGHGYAKDNISSAVDGLRAGTDLDCDTFSKNHVYNHNAARAVNQSLLSMATLDAAVKNLVMVQMRLGLFDNNKLQQPYAQIPPSIVGSLEHQAISREATRQAIILLKNDPVSSSSGSGVDAASRKPVLPFKPGLKLAVIGKHFNSTGKLSSDYSGPLCHTPPLPGGVETCIESPLEAFARINVGGVTNGAVGCCAYGYQDNISAAVQLAQESEAVVLMVGLTGSDEGEGHDREQITLCDTEQQLVAAVLALRKPAVLVTVHGGALSYGNFTLTAPAILDANYPGAYFGATTIAEAVFGIFSPSGRLAATQYPAEFVTQSNMTEMSVTKAPGRTYLHYMHKAEFQFGWGLSYGPGWSISAGKDHQSVQRLRQRIEAVASDGSVLKQQELLVQVQRLPEDTHGNGGSSMGDGSLSTTPPARQTVLCFWRPRTVPHAHNRSVVVLPRKQLFDYAGVDALLPGQNGSLACTLNPRRHLAVARMSDGAKVLWPGEYELYATLGSATPDQEEAVGRIQDVGQQGEGRGAVAFLASVVVSGAPRIVEAGLDLR